jgi:branched-chain amino acid transport system substrate-binding protein
MILQLSGRPSFMSMRLNPLLAVLFLAIASFSARAEDAIKIGGLLETSGALASLGQPALEGALLAVDQLNAKGGIQGRKVEFVNVNTESDNTRAVTAAKRLIQQNDITAIVGPTNSGSAFAVIDTVQQAPIVMIANGASRGIVLPPEEKKWLFLSPLTDVLVQSVMMADMKKRGITRIALLHADSPFGTSGRDQLERFAAKFGLQLVMEQAYGNDDKDMTPQLTKIRGTDAQAVVIWATGPGQAIATRNYRQLGLQVPLYLSHAANDFNFLRLTAGSAEGAFIPSSKLYVADALPQTDPQRAVLESFTHEYQAKYGRQPATFAGNGYDATMLLAAAIERAGPDRQKVREAVEATKDYRGVTAVYSYAPDDHFGASPDSVVLLTVKDGKFVLAPN